MDARVERVHGRARWRRFAAVFVPGAVVAAVLLLSTANGALAATFAASGGAFKVSATSLAGDGFVQYGAIATSADGSRHPVAVAGIRNARLSDLCQSVRIATPFGSVVMRITAGGAGHPVQATNLVVDADQLAGDATFENIEIGRDAATLDRVPGVRGQSGGFGQQAEHVEITNLRQQAWTTTAGTFKLTGLRMSVSLAEKECF
jgi:hypothetical protein